MRTLAIIAAGFVLGNVPSVFSFSTGLRIAFWALAGIALLLAFLVWAKPDVLQWLRHGNRFLAVKCLLFCGAFLCGSLYGTLRDKYSYQKPAEFETDSGMFAVELTEYPTEANGGPNAEGLVKLGNRLYRVSVFYSQNFDGLEPGDVLTGAGKLTSNRNGTDIGNYNLSVGIPVRLTLKNPELSCRGERGSLKFFPQRLAFRMRGMITSLYREEDIGFLTALLTGNRDILSFLDMSRLRIAGNYHALAVSGMHVSILMSSLYVLTLKRRRLFPLIGIPVLLTFCLLTGMSASVVRASIMQLFLMMAPLFRRESDAPTALSAAAFSLVLANPWCLRNTGFLLSFLATSGILLLSSPLKKLLQPQKSRRNKQRILRFLGESASQSIAATVFTLPVLILSFRMFSTYGILTNLLTLPVISLIFTLGMLSVVLGFLWLPAAALLSAPVHWMIRYVLYITNRIATLPFAAITSGYRAFLSLVLISYAVFAILAILVSAQPQNAKIMIRGAAVILSIALAAVFTVSVFREIRRSVTLSVLDVGQGQCVLAESGNRAFAVDCGGSNRDAAGEILTENVLSSGRNSLDYLLITHYDLDHCGGVPYVLRMLNVEALILPDVPDETGKRAELELLAAEAGVPCFYLTADLVLPFGKGEAALYAPVSEDGGNASCLTACFSFGDFDFLITGDLTESEEVLLVDRHNLSDIELLLAGHHGAAGSTGEYLLNAIAPETVIISVGRNSYGHPSDKTLERIRNSGAEIIRTDEYGTVRIER